MSLFLVWTGFYWCSKSHWCCSPARQLSLLPAVKSNLNDVLGHESAKPVVNSCCRNLVEEAEGKGEKIELPDHALLFYVSLVLPKLSFQATMLASGRLCCDVWGSYLEKYVWNVVPEYTPLSTPTSSFSKCGELYWWDGEERINWSARKPSVTKETNQGNTVRKTKHLCRGKQEIGSETMHTFRFWDEEMNDTHQHPSWYQHSGS